MRQSIHKVVIGAVVAAALVGVSATRLSAAGGDPARPAELSHDPGRSRRG
jgi:hypothetical protein